MCNMFTYLVWLRIPRKKLRLWREKQWLLLAHEKGGKVWMIEPLIWLELPWIVAVWMRNTFSWEVWFETPQLEDLSWFLGGVKEIRLISIDQEGILSIGLEWFQAGFIICWEEFGIFISVIYLELGSVLVVKLRVDIEEMNDTTVSDCCRTTYEGECPYYWVRMGEGRILLV